MPIDLRTLIDKMLQKNPDTRADWSELRKEPFFCESQPLKVVSSNLYIGLEKEEYLRVGDDLMLRKKESDREPTSVPETNYKQQKP
jgi:serine/threonine protein kinase